VAEWKRDGKTAWQRSWNATATCLVRQRSMSDDNVPLGPTRFVGTSPGRSDVCFSSCRSRTLSLSGLHTRAAAAACCCRLLNDVAYFVWRMPYLNWK